MSLSRPFRRRRREPEVEQPLPPEEPFAVEDEPGEPLRPHPARELTQRIEPVADEPTGVLEAPEEIPFGPSPKKRRWIRLAPVPTFAIGFFFLLGAVTAVGFAQFTSSGIAPWLSIGYSGAAVVLTLLALIAARGR